MSLTYNPARLILMKCSVCSGNAVAYNKAKQPVCGKHTRTIGKAPLCPECGIAMAPRLGKYGNFWGCAAYPSCDGIRKM